MPRHTRPGRPPERLRSSASSSIPSTSTARLAVSRREPEQAPGGLDADRPVEAARELGAQLSLRGGGFHAADVHAGHLHTVGDLVVARAVVGVRGHAQPHDHRRRDRNHKCHPLASHCLHLGVVSTSRAESRLRQRFTASARLRSLVPGRPGAAGAGGKYRGGRSWSARSRTLGLQRRKSSTSFSYR